MLKRRLTVAEEREIRDNKYLEMLHSEENVSEIFTRPPYGITKTHSAE